MKFELKPVKHVDLGRGKPKPTARIQRKWPRGRTGILSAPNETVSFRSMVRIRAADRLYRGKVTSVEIAQGKEGVSVALHFWDGTVQRL